MARRDNWTALAQQDPAAYLAAARDSAARARRMFTLSMVISVVLLLCYPAAWLAVILLFDSSRDVGQGFYLVYIWFLLCPFFVVSVIFTVITWIRKNSAKKTAVAAEAWVAARRP